jgi:hypothetical protein
MPPVIARRTALAVSLSLTALAALAASCRRASRADEIADLDGGAVDPFASDAKAIVLVFVSTDCPISNRYAPEIRRLFERFAPRGVDFRLVYPTAEETPAMIRDHVREYALPLSVLRDPRHALVARARVTVTPESAVFARGGALVYHGRIDDRQVDFGEARPAPTHRDLEDALDAVLAARAPARATAPAIGCAIASAN